MRFHVKLLPVLLLLFSSVAFAGEWNSGKGSISPQQQYAIDTAISNDKSQRYNQQQLRATPRYETSNERNQRLSIDRDNYYESIR